MNSPHTAEACRNRTSIAFTNEGDRWKCVDFWRTLDISRAGLVLTAAAICATIQIAATSAFGLTTADLVPSRRYGVKTIDVSGQHALSKDEILSILATKVRPSYEVWEPLPDFDPQTFTDDLGRIKRLYQAHGYYLARVSYDLDVHDDDVTIYLSIHESKPVRVTAIETRIKSGGPRPEILQTSFELPLKRGDIFDQDAYQASAYALLELYTSHAYAHARVHRHALVDPESGHSRVWFDVDPGIRCSFGATSISGARHVDPMLVREQLTYKTGEPFDSRKLTASRKAILALNLFSAVDFSQRSSPDTAIVPILISVQEGPTHTLNGGIGYNTQTQLNATINWTDYNFLSGGRQLSLTGTYSDVTSLFDVKLLQPRLFSPESSLTLETSQQQQTYQTYTGNISGFDPHFDYRVSPALTFSLGWRLEYLKFNSVSTSTASAIGGFRRDGILSGPMAGLSFDNTEDAFNPQAGERLWLLGNISDRLFGADYRYWRVIGEARKYYLLGWQTVLASRVKIGLSDTTSSIGDVPLSERFYSGGEGSVRGYGLRRIGRLSASNDPLGGLSLVEGSVELRRPLFWKFNGALFFDCGQVATKAYDLRVDALQCGYGPALGLNSPVGPVSVYLGFPTRKPRGDSFWQFYFSIGQYF